MGNDLDPRLTFETFVVGAANRLASAAARRAAENPGAGYNPLFLYSASGLGKSHILTAIASHSHRHYPERKVVYQMLEGYLDDLAESLERGTQEKLRERYAAVDILLLDDVQFLTGQTQAQELLLRTLDALTGRGAQVALASDRPPAEINGLDARLLSRFSGGLIVDIGPPDYETRVAIIRRKAEARSMVLSAGVAEALARFPLKNVRELQGALNRLFAVQELEGRPVRTEDLPGLMGDVADRGAAEVEGLSGADAPGFEPEAAVSQPVWHREVVRAVSVAEDEGFDPARLRALLRDPEEEPEGWRQLLSTFEDDLQRLRQIRLELDELGNPWPEAGTQLLRDPDRIEEAESLLLSARERGRAFPPVSDGPLLDGLPRSDYPPLALRAADRLVRAERPDYNPLYVHCGNPDRARGLLEATGRTLLDINSDATVGLISVAEFSEEFIRAISDGVAGAWRERWWSVDLLLVHDVEALASTERAQEEFFHLFEALKRRGARILLAADRSPSALGGVDERLRSRFEGGLVVDLGVEERAPAPIDERVPAPAQSVPAPVDEADPTSAESASAPTDEVDPAPAETSEPSDETELVSAAATGEDGGSPAAPDPMQGFDDGDDLQAVRELAGVGRTRDIQSGAGGSGAAGDGSASVARDDASHKAEETWRPRRDRVVWDWPDPSERIVEDQR